MFYKFGKIILIYTDINLWIWGSLPPQILDFFYSQIPTYCGESDFFKKIKNQHPLGVASS
jgi:hypothetical protein